ncbi:neuraminidase-like domain-containing protein [Streptomyces sp. NBC_00081]|uniref:Tc toxin subunit A-related protein n=1 Tax=Streptomyces sp. NBC_00081 TaxID=2975646 RepID=UPI00324DE221
MTERFTVYGSVRAADSQEPVSDVVVHAFDKDLPSLRSDQFLGRATTDSDGDYTIEFGREEFRAHEMGGAELYVLVFDDEGGKQLLGSSSARVDGEAETRIDVAVVTQDSSGLSEYERLFGILTPLLGRIVLADVTADDIRFLAEESREELSRVAWLAAAHRLAVRTGVPAEAFYGWARNRPPLPDAWREVPASVDPEESRRVLRAILASLVTMSAQELRGALHWAIDNEIIPASFGERVDEAVECLVRGSYTPHHLIGRLRDAESGLPAAGVSVRISDLESGPTPVVIGHEVTDGDGVFAIWFATPPGQEQPGQETLAHRYLRIGADMGDDEEFWSTDLEAFTDHESVLTFDVPVPHAPEPASHELSQVVQVANLQLSDELSSFLDTHQIRTLGDIRRLGGLAQAAELPLGADDPAVRILDAHADLSLLSPDVGTNIVLIGHGFHSVADIAASSRPDFVAQLHETVGDYHAAHLHTVAAARTSVLKHVLGKLALDQANGWTPEPATPALGPTPDPLPKSCGCADCEAAVSPAAYLADLVAYAATRLRSNGGKVDLDFLEDTFHQRFGDLPTDCSSVDTQVRQVRLAVEVLRSYAAAHPPAAPQEDQLHTDTEQYLLEVYTRLLTRFGTSYEEVRLARTASPEERQAVADRLGIVLTQPRPDPQTTGGDELDQLFLRTVSTAAHPATLTEQAVERLFGVVDTTRDPLSDGTKTGDDDVFPELLKWRFEGVHWPTNTDARGMLHLRLTYTLTPLRTTAVEVYRDGGRTELVARGEVYSPVGGVRRVRLLPENGSGLSGEVTVVGSTPDNSAISVAIVPKMLLWRLNGLRAAWRRQDAAVDPYSPAYAPSSERRAVVDPDVVGPDDFRHPESAEPAFALWTSRRKWIDQLLDALAAPTKTVTVEGVAVQVPDAEAALARMYLAVTYGSSVRTPWRTATPLTELDALGELLESGTVPEVKAAGTRVTDDLNLTVDAFRQVLRTRQKARAWEADPKLDTVSPEEWTEFFSVLVRAQKERFTADWVGEEDAKAIRLGPEVFWSCLRQPREGTWPPARFAGRPLIDPDQVKLADLPEPTAGTEAIALWQARRAELTAASAAIKAARETNGFDAMLRTAIDHPTSTDPPGYPLETLSAELADEDPDVVEQAVASIENELHLTVDDFRRIVALNQRAAPSSPHKPTPEEWTELYAVLTTSYKVKHLHPAWAAEEGTTGLPTEYWRALKAQLPRARASGEVRQEWTHALGLRCAPPVIDPDLVDVTMFRGSGVQAALTLWQQRRTWVDGELAGLDALPATLAGFDTAVAQKLSVPALDLVALQESHEQGAAIQDRLDQIPLSQPAFTYLLKVRALLAAGQDVAATEWESVRAILMGAAKSHRAGEWREQERIAGVTLSPDVFVLPGAPSAAPPAPTPKPPQANRWRVGERDRADWLDTLQSRSQQELDLLSAFHDTVDEAEEATLPALRDALTTAVGVGGDLAAKSAWVTERLFVDGRAGGCQKTTRVAQAMESLQGLLFAARTNHEGALQPLGLSLDAPEFDQEWRWIGSYATWRSAMFVFMYPENVAVGSLRRHQTPAYRDLLKAVRSNRRLTPADACRLASEYAAYYEDIAKLSIGATTQGKLRVNSGTACTPGYVAYKPLVFIFGTGGVSKRLYWSTFDPAEDAADYAQSFWETVPGAPGSCTVVGATVYERSPADRRLFLFVRTGDYKLQFLTCDLESGNWSAPADLPLPSGDARWFECVLNQTNDTSYAPLLAIKAYGDFFLRRLNPEGTAWEDGDWKKFQLDSNAWGLAGVGNLLGAVGGQLVVRAGEYLTWRFSSYFAAIPDSRSKNGRYIGTILWAKAKDAFQGRLVEQWTNGTVDEWPQVITTPIGTQFQLEGLQSIAPNCGYIDHSSYAYERLNKVKRIGKAGSASSAPPRELNGLYLRLVALEERLSDAPFVSTTHLIAPRAASYLIGQFTIPTRLDAAAAKVRRSMVKSALSLQSDSATHRTVAEEAYFFVPMALSDALRRSGEYVAALEFARTVYDYTAPAAQRKIYHGLVEEESLPSVLKRNADWLRDPLDPHAVAASRQLAYTRFTQQAIVRTLLDFADDEFTQDTAETVPRARSLYAEALSVLDLPELQQTLGSCSDVIGKIHIGLGADVPPWGVLTMIELGADMDRLKDFGTLSAVVPQVRQVLKSDIPWDDRVTRARALVTQAVAEETPRSTLADSVRRMTEVDSRALACLLASPAISRAVEQAGDAAGNRFLTAVAHTAGVKPAVLQTEQLSLPWLHDKVTAASTAGDLAFTPDLWPIGPQSSGAAAGLLFPDHLPDFEDDEDEDLVYIPHDWWPTPLPSPVGISLTPSVAFCVPPNPVLAALRLHADVNLHKIRTCRNIAGMKRALDPYAAPTDTVSGLPTIGMGGQLVTPGTNGVRPTLYRYGVLVQRAKELVASAQQIESAMLSALEKRDAEAYSMLRARQDLELAQAGVQLENLRVRQANDGVTLASLQQARARIQADHYQELLDEGLLELESIALAQMQEAVSYLGTAADFSFAAAAVQGAAAVAGAVAGGIVGSAAGPLGTAVGAGGGALVGALSGGLGGVAAGLSAVSSGYSSLAGEYSTLAQIKLTAASFERRRQDWDLALELAHQDMEIGEQQVTLANDTVDIAKQEKLIAETRNTHAKDTVTFLATKFTNVDLYDWMGDVLEEVYDTLLQQATSMARLAENQLAFERQEPLQSFIQSDYWQAPDAGFASDDLEGTGVDRRGLTGAARLLQDLSRLDHYAFTSDRRKLQLSKTFSLSMTAPTEFQQFRETGVLPFATPMRAFNQDFPGHYLRLIKNVRVSVIALVPPTHGIHAELSTTGLSRVVIGPDVFQTVPVRRDPEVIALSAPVGSNEVVSLEAQPPGMLLPFEGTGVDTVWELRMPKAANLPVDYHAIADVLFSVDFTALPSWDYGKQVVESLGGSVGAELPVSMRLQLPDQWYDLHNPETTSEPMLVRFRIGREDFPANLDALKIQHVALRFGVHDGTPFEVPVTLRFTEKDSPVTSGGTAKPVDGIISTRRGNAGSWMSSFTGKKPVGEWELSLPDTEAVRARFASGDLDDVLLVVSYTGRPPDWPE